MISRWWMQTSCMHCICRTSLFVWKDIILYIHIRMHTQLHRYKNIAYMLQLQTVLLLFVKLLLVSDSEQCAREAAFREAPSVWLRSCFSLAGHGVVGALSRCFWNALVLHEHKMSDETRSFFETRCENWKVCLNCAGVGGLHTNTSREVLRAR